MKLSIVILCWNDLGVIAECIESVLKETKGIEFEMIVADNGSTDGAVDYVRRNFATVQVVENKSNLGFAKGNNAGIKLARGEYVLILNPDTIICEKALEKLVAFADDNPDAGAFGCRVLNADGTFQDPARPIPTVRGYLIAALGMRWLARLSAAFDSDCYVGWDGRSQREVGFQSGCCVMFRGNLLRRLGGFDEQFFYHFEESDLCYRIWKSGSSILYYPDAEIIHLGGQSSLRWMRSSAARRSENHFPIRLDLETYRSGYRFFYKHYGASALGQLRRIFLLHLLIRYFGYSLLNMWRRSESLTSRLAMYRTVIKWNFGVNPLRFIEKGKEPDLGYAPLGPASNLIELQ